MLRAPAAVDPSHRPQAVLLRPGIGPSTPPAPKLHPQYASRKEGRRKPGISQRELARRAELPAGHLGYMGGVFGLDR